MLPLMNFSTNSFSGISFPSILSFKLNFFHRGYGLVDEKVKRFSANCYFVNPKSKEAVYVLDAVGLTSTLSFVRFSFISALTPIAAKYSSRNILMKSFEVSETKTNV